MLAAGAVYIASRQQAANRAAIRSGVQPKLRSEALTVEAGEFEYDEPELPAERSQRQIKSQPAPSAQRSSSILEALKEELFQLEVDRKQGNISQQEYEKAKSALDHTLERALKREAAKQT